TRIARAGPGHWFHVLVEGSEDLSSLLGDPYFDYSPVVVIAGSCDQTSPAETVNETGDIGIAGDHSLADVARGQLGRVAAAQDAEDVVLVEGELGGGFEKLFPGFDDSCGGDLQPQEHFLFPRRERALLFELAGHPSGHSV